jgi:hypothetical protein
MPLVLMTYELGKDGSAQLVRHKLWGQPVSIGTRTMLDSVYCMLYCRRSRILCADMLACTPCSCFKHQKEVSVGLRERLKPLVYAALSH